MGVASKVGDLAFKGFTAALGVTTVYLAATFSVNVYRGLSWHNAQSVLLVSPSLVVLSPIVLEIHLMTLQARPRLLPFRPSREPSSSPNQQPKKRRRKEIVKAIRESDLGHATHNHMKTGKKAASKIAPSVENSFFPTSASPSRNDPQKIRVDDSGHVRYLEKSGSGHFKPQTGKASNTEQTEIPFQHREQNGNRELIDLNVAPNKHPMKTSLFHRKEGSSYKPKRNVLDRAIREPENMVAESRPPALDLQDADITSQSVKRRLSQEIKQQLAKVAQVSHGKVSKELLSRLMSIVGHLVNVRTLKDRIERDVEQPNEYL